MPLEVVMDAQAAAGLRQAARNSLQQEGTVVQKPQLRRQLNNDWLELENADGEVYYANIVTKVTSWDLPVEAQESPADVRRNDQQHHTEDAENMSPNKSAAAAAIYAKIMAAEAVNDANESRAADMADDGKPMDQSVAALNAMAELSFTASRFQGHHAAHPPPAQQGGADEHAGGDVLDASTVWGGGDGGDKTLMGASFLGREVDAMSDLAALADMSMMQPTSGLGHALADPQLGSASSSDTAAKVMLLNQEHQEQHEHQQLGSASSSDLAALVDLSVMQTGSPSRSLLSRPNAAEAASREVCGVGLVLQQARPGMGVLVEAVLRGGAADESGVVSAGDEVCVCVCACARARANA